MLLNIPSVLEHPKKCQQWVSESVTKGIMICREIGFVYRYSSSVTLQDLARVWPSRVWGDYFVSCRRHGSNSFEEERTFVETIDSLPCVNERKLQLVM